MTFWEKFKAMMAPPPPAQRKFYISDTVLHMEGDGKMYKLAVDENGYVKAVPYAEWLVRKKG